MDDIREAVEEAAGNHLTVFAKQGVRCHFGAIDRPPSWLARILRTIEEYHKHVVERCSRLDYFGQVTLEWSSVT